MASWAGTVEGVAVNPAFWQGRRVFLTGHTGFKGGWLALWLQSMGAQVYGYALPPPSGPAFFTESEVETGLAGHTLSRVEDGAALTAALRAAQPEIVLHLAAQALVREAYANPVATYATNVMGTVHLLEGVRKTPSVRAVVNVTTDKCYENREWIWGYREDEALGGYDPYSSSKACSELVTSAYRQSFLADAGVALASARAGNVIGGGDWATDRLIPDLLRALDTGVTVDIRAPQATRPWQHVLEPLSGYLALAEGLYEKGAPFAAAWNFGPADDDARPVSWILEQMASMQSGLRWRIAVVPKPHEAHLLKLDSSKARSRLDWQPRWKLVEALQRTLQWHVAWRAGQPMRAFSLAQINDYMTTIRAT